MDPRKEAVLKAVVAQYIDTAQPVGSGHVVDAPGVGVSSATVRSEMVALEQEGYLVQPHTSAGRIPTDLGYRFFVDSLGSPGALGPLERRQVRQFFAHLHGEVAGMLDQTSRLLSNLTDYAAVVVGPTHDSSVVRSVQVVGLGPKLVLVVVVLADGAVEKRALDLPTEVDDEVLAKVTGQLNAHMHGRPLLPIRPPALTGERDIDNLLTTAVGALSEMGHVAEPELIFVGGSSRMAQAFDAVDTVRSVLSILEEQLVVVELIERILDRGLSVAIGAEHGFEPLAACALVVAPLSVDGEEAGILGVLGPTRMHYPRALAAVQAVGARLGEHLSHSAESRAGTRDTNG